MNIFELDHKGRENGVVSPANFLPYLTEVICYGRPLLQAWLLPDLNTISNYCVRESSLSSVVMVLAFRPGVPSSNPVQILYFCHAFIHLFLCYGLCS